MTDYITVSELADYLNIDDADDDNALQAAITSASSGIDAWCGRNFGTDTSATARTFRCTDPYVATVDDFWDTASLIVKTDMGDNGTYNETWTVTRDYVIEPLNGVVDGIPGWPYYRISALGSFYFPTTSMGSGRRPRLQVTAKWGWAATPDAVIQATKIKAARLFRRKDSPEGAGGFDSGGGGFSVPLIRAAPREDPDVAALLAPYRRLAIFA